MKTKDPVIFILPKSPLPKEGRYGKKEQQDWYQTCVLAAKLLREHPEGTILVVTDFKVAGEGGEYAPYWKALCDLGADQRKIDFIFEGQETISELTVAAEYAYDWVRELVIVVAPSHYLRVQYLCWKDGIKASIRVPDRGRPRPKEFLTDWFLTLAFPVIDFLGLRKRFLNFVTKRRLAGKL